MRPGIRFASMARRVCGISLHAKALAALIILYSTAVWAIKYDVYGKSLLTSDMAISCNTLWNTDFRSRILYTDILYVEYGYRSLLNLHFCPTLLLLVPFYKLFPSPVLLLLFQTAMPGITAFLLYRFGLTVLESERRPEVSPFPWTANPRLLSLGIAAAYLYHPFLRMATVGSVYGFQPDSAIPPLVVGLAHALYRQRWRVGLVLLVLLFGLKENMPLLGSLLGVGMVFLSRGASPYRKAGVAILALGALFFLAGVVVLPWFTGLPNKNLAILDRLTPGVLFGQLRVLKSWGVLFAFLPATLAPEILALAIPEWMIYTAAGMRPFDWHVFPSVAIFAVACVIGASRLLDPPDRRRLQFLRTIQGRAWSLLASYLLLLSLFVVGICQVGLTLGKLSRYGEEVDRECLKRIKAFVPQTGYLAATSDLMVHFANRPHLLATTQFERADYVLVNVRNPGILYRYGYDLRMIEGVGEMLKAGTLEVIQSCGSQHNEVFLFGSTSNPR